MGLILSFSASKNFGGYDISARSFFQDVSESLNAKFPTPNRASICEARQKLSWEAFAYLLNHFNESIAPELDSLKWSGRHVYAVDGSLLTLSHSQELKNRFPDKDTGLCKTHYPKSRVVLATHVLSGIPKAFRIDDQFVGERSMFQSMLSEFEDDSVFLLDRGFDGVASLNKILESKKNFICRLRSELWSSREVYAFTKSKAKQLIVTLRNKQKEEITVRLLKYKNDRHGNPIVLATNLYDQEVYAQSELWDLYTRRWDIETSYYRVKRLFKLENFHSKKINGILQEVWANLIVIAMSSYLVMKSWKEKMRGLIKSKKAPNFKNATLVFQKYFVRLISSKNKTVADRIIKTILNEISIVLFIRQFGRKNPRVSKQSLSTWVGGRKNKTKNKKCRNTIRRGIYA